MSFLNESCLRKALVGLLNTMTVSSIRYHRDFQGGESEFTANLLLFVSNFQPILALIRAKCSKLLLHL